MLLSDVLNSCRNGPVAEAAVASIGGDFAERVRLKAVARGQSVGDFTACTVRHFADQASERDWRQLATTMEGEDLPLLMALQAVLLRMMLAPDARQTRMQSRSLEAASA